MPGVTIDHGDKRMTVTQSWLRDFLACPERARRQVFTPAPSNNDATAVGTATHVFMEQRLGGVRFHAAYDAAVGRLEALASAEDFQYVQVKTMATMLRHLDACVRTFDRHVVPQIAPGGYVEETLECLLTEHHDWEIMLEGTPDYVDPLGRVWDWKTANRPYDAYEASNWMIQPTAYTFLATHGLAFQEDDEINDFTYCIAVKPHGDMQFVDVHRTMPDWSWLGKIAKGALDMVLHMPGEWPVRHDHWLCSARWCPFWDTCRGAHHPSGLPSDVLDDLT